MLFLCKNDTAQDVLDSHKCFHADDTSTFYQHEDVTEILKVLNQRPR